MDAFEDSDLPYTVDVLDVSQLSDRFSTIVKRQRIRLSLDSRPPALALGDVAEIVMGQSPSKENVSSESGMPLLNGPTEFGAYHPTPVQYTSDPRKRSKEGDILFCVRGSTTGRMNWADREYAIGRGLAAIRHREDSTLQPFVRAVIEHGLSELLVQATGSTFPNVSAHQLRQLYYPNLGGAQQRAISHVLCTFDNNIELNRRMNRTLEEIARVIFKDWFIDFGPTRAKMEGREPYLPADLWDLFPDRFTGWELGEIPEGWNVKPLGECFNLTMGQSPPGRTYNEAGEGMPFFQGRTDFGFRYPENRKFCTEPKRIADPDDTLVSVRAPVGDINVAWERCCIGRGLAALRHNTISV